MIRSTLFAPIVLLSGCAGTSGEQSSANSGKASWTPPSAGTIVVADSMKIAEDQLNNGMFSVKLAVAEGNDASKKDGFRYDLHVGFGTVSKQGTIIMPFGGDNLKPLLRKGAGYEYIIGFVPKDITGDTAFHEYYSIASANNYIRITPLKGFIIE